MSAPKVPWRVSDYRHNSGDWIILGDDGTGQVTVLYCGDAKRGQHSAADPEGQARAALIVRAVNNHASLVAVAQKFIDTIEAVENRCMAADGPVTPTCEEITDDELRAIYVAARAALSASQGEPKA